MTSEFDEFANKAKRAAAESVESVKEKLSSLDNLELEGLREAAGELADEAAAFVRKYPLQSLLGAAAAGLVIGVLLKSKR